MTTPAAVTIAFIGCGSIALKHLQALPDCRDPPLLVTAVCDPNTAAAEKFADAVAAVEGQKRPRVFATLQDALAAEPGAGLFEAVDIMVPNFLHEELTRVAFAAGKHVLKEKPVGMDVESAQRILSTVPADGSKLLMIAENAQWWPELVHAKRLVDGGAIGDVIGIYAKCWESAGGEWGGDYEPGRWRSDTKLAGGGFVFDSLSHWVRPLRMIFGEIEEVVSVTSRTLPTMEGASAAQSIARFANGKTAIIEAILTPSVIGPQPWFRFQGTKGEIVVDGDFAGGGTLFNEQYRDGEPFPKVGGWDASYSAELSTFARAVANIGEARADLKKNATDALNDLRVVLAIHEAARTHTWVKTGSV